MTERQLRRMYQDAMEESFKSEATYNSDYVAKAYRQGIEDTLTSIKEE